MGKLKLIQEIKQVKSLDGKTSFAVPRTESKPEKKVLGLFPSLEETLKQFNDELKPAIIAAMKAAFGIEETGKLDAKTYNAKLSHANVAITRGKCNSKQEEEALAVVGSMAFNVEAAINPDFDLGDDAKWEDYADMAQLLLDSPDEEQATTPPPADEKVEKQVNAATPPPVSENLPAPAQQLPADTDAIRAQLTNLKTGTRAAITASKSLVAAQKALNEAAEAVTVVLEAQEANATLLEQSLALPAGA